MKKIAVSLITTGVAAAIVLSGSALAAPKRSTLGQERSVDAVASIRKEAFSLKAAITAAAASPTAADVGDADSFGRNVKYLGTGQTNIVNALEDCTPDPTLPPDPNDRCITLQPQPNTTTIDESNLGIVALPGKATHSLICFALTPLASFEFANNTGVPQSSARYSMLATVTIQSDVLNDPALIDPTTGAPFNGVLTVSLSTYSESRSLAVGERAEKALRLSRNCIGGIISKSSLVDTYGLTDNQADKFFNKPIHLSFGVTGTLRLVDFASYFYGIRFYGD